LSGEPFDKAGNSIISKNKTASEWSTNRRKKISEARKRGVKLLFIVEEDIEKSLEENAHRIYYSRMNLEEDFNKDASPSDILIVHIGKKMADIILKSGKKTITAVQKNILENGKSELIKISTEIEMNVKQTHEVLPTENVLGFIEGSDLKSELIVVTAHYDHIGKEGNQVFNGADDDGSGTVGVMEIAKAFMEAKKQGKGPRRSILFMTVAGEEKGLLGSDYYSRHPEFPLANTVANLNIDMIGRIDKEHEGNSNYIYIIGSNMLSKELHELNESCNSKYVNLALDYTYNSADDPNRYYYRSDHYNFAKNNIPVIFYFNGVHEDYHQETDEVQKIDFQKMEKISRLIFFTAWELANRNDRIKLDKK
ncbi:MAG: M28 family peptidase, partial [Bacteroidota bacterium]